MKRWMRAVAGGLSAALLATAGVVASGSTPASAVWSPPAYVRSLGGDGVPALYTCGASSTTPSPTTSSSAITSSFQMRRYDMQGNPLGDFFREDQKGQPYSVAVDPRNGDIYVPELKDGGERSWFAKYDKNGVFKSAFRLTNINHYHAWITVDGSGTLYVMDSHYTVTTANPARIVKVILNDARSPRRPRS